MTLYSKSFFEWQREKNEIGLTTSNLKKDKKAQKVKRSFLDNAKQRASRWTSFSSSKQTAILRTKNKRHEPFFYLQPVSWSPNSRNQLGLERESEGWRGRRFVHFSQITNKERPVESGIKMKNEAGVAPVQMFKSLRTRIPDLCRQQQRNTWKENSGRHWRMWSSLSWQHQEAMLIRVGVRQLSFAARDIKYTLSSLSAVTDSLSAKLLNQHSMG